MSSRAGAGWERRTGARVRMSPAQCYLPSMPVAMRVRHRAAGLLLVAASLVILAGILFAPVPDFEELEVRTGTVVSTERERYSPCRSGDCLRTMVTVRHADGVHRYHFAQTDPAVISVGEQITLRVAPHVSGLEAVRVWQAEQAGRIVREYGRQTSADRTIRLILAVLAPLLLLLGIRQMRRWDWAGNPVPR